MDVTNPVIELLDRRCSTRAYAPQPITSSTSAPPSCTPP